MTLAEKELNKQNEFLRTKFITTLRFYSVILSYLSILEQTVNTMDFSKYQVKYITTTRFYFVILSVALFLI